jgi:hypothetical protein
MQTSENEPGTHHALRLPAGLYHFDIEVKNLTRNVRR